jgi:hypothetical protein
MSIQENTAGARETPARAGTERGRERLPDAQVTGPSRDDKLADAWLDGNRHLVEANRFFALAIEPDEIVKGPHGRKERKWVPSIWVRSRAGEDAEMLVVAHASEISHRRFRGSTG